MPPESSRQGQKLLLSLIGAVCAFLATQKIMFHSNIDVDILYRRLEIAKYVRMVCIGALLAITLLSVIENYRDYKADQIFRENIPYSVE